MPRTTKGRPPGPHVRHSEREQAVADFLVQFRRVHDDLRDLGQRAIGLGLGPHAAALVDAEQRLAQTAGTGGGS